MESAYINAICERIVQEFSPQRVILFGSRARGSSDNSSDIDLLVILPFEGSPIRKAAQISARLDHRVPLDILARTPEMVDHRLSMGDFFMQEVMQTGRVLYDAAHQ